MSPLLAFLLGLGGLYLLIGLSCALRWIPWGERTFFVRWIRPTSATTSRLSSAIATMLAIALVGTLWPLYALLRRAARRARPARERFEDLCRRLAESPLGTADDELAADADHELVDAFHAMLDDAERDEQNQRSEVR